MQFMPGVTIDIRHGLMNYSASFFAEFNPWPKGQAVPPEPGLSTTCLEFVDDKHSQSSGAVGSDDERLFDVGGF